MLIGPVIGFSAEKPPSPTVLTSGQKQQTLSEQLNQSSSNPQSKQTLAASKKQKAKGNAASTRKISNKNGYPNHQKFIKKHDKEIDVFFKKITDNAQNLNEKQIAQLYALFKSAMQENYNLKMMNQVLKKLDQLNRNMQTLIKQNRQSMKLMMQLIKQKSAQSSKANQKARNTF
jgi:hypothetical protein